MKPAGLLEHLTERTRMIFDFGFVHHIRFDDWFSEIRPVDDRHVFDTLEVIDVRRQNW